MVDRCHCSRRANGGLSVEFGYVTRPDDGTGHGACDGSASAAGEPERRGTGGVIRTSPEADDAPAPAESSLATRQGSRGLEVDLIRADVTGDLLTVELHFRNPRSSFASATMAVAEVSVIDDATSRRYGVVKDQAGQFMAAPLARGRTDRVMARVPANDSAVVWFKFPAPPPTSETVSINIPDVAPFDGIRVQR